MATVSILGSTFFKTYDHISRQPLADIVLTGWGAAIYPGPEYKRERLTTEAVPMVEAAPDKMRLIKGGQGA
jgi:hypothetical protein